MMIMLLFMLLREVLIIDYDGGYTIMFYCVYILYNYVCIVYLMSHNVRGIFSNKTVPVKEDHRAMLVCSVVEKTTGGGSRLRLKCSRWERCIL